MKTIRSVIRKVIAYLHWSDRIVCEESKGLGFADYHTEEDAKPLLWRRTDGPMPYWLASCRRCGKEFAA